MPYASDREPFMPIPENLSVEELITELQISWRWWHPMFYFMAVFCVMWMGFLAFFYYMLLTSGFSNAELGWITLLFPIIHVFAGIGMTYWTICGFINSTTLTIDIYDIIVEHYPLPWPKGRKVIDKKQVEQLYVTEKVSRNNKGGSTMISYNVHAILKSGKSQKLVTGLHSAAEAQFIENKMEKFLRIEDRPVTGEFKK